VIVLGGNVIDIEVVSHRETAGFFDSARDPIIPQVIRRQNPNVDIVTGATVSSFALRLAINNALQ
jgi:uncharacterized protein with FMN-binding domain